MCVMAVVGAAPCQCFSPGSNQTTSPGRISSMGPPQRCARPQPAVTIRVWPSGWECQAVRAPGSNVTLAPRTRAGSGASNRGSIRTLPVKYSAGPLPDGCEPLLLISITSNLKVVYQVLPHSDGRVQHRLGPGYVGIGRPIEEGVAQCTLAGLPGAALRPQLTAFLTSALILAPSSAVNSFSAK